VEIVSQVLAWARARGIAVTPWGLGSSVTGAPLAAGGIALDLAQLDEIHEINETALYVTVQAGKLGSELEEFLNRRGYTLNHSPQSI
jgi:alkyldihydroxyacetonephosphate synthase